MTSSTGARTGWYLADMVQEITVEGDSRNVIHINLKLIRAASPEEAFDKATALGRSFETTYENTEGKKVQVAFRGLRDLLGVIDDLEDGSELLYQELVGMSEQEVQNLIPPKAALAAFSVARPVSRPNYLDKDIIAEAEARFGVSFEPAATEGTRPTGEDTEPDH